ncbi:MAG TPA: polysaccharide pyruvyl transferase family protein [Anaerolineales bacterium]|nr:polysaccharide pyruvyl transferase family protein [Anaerolineales bacterium]
MFRDTHHYITDSAYAVLLTQYQPPTKQYKLAFMPHYQTRNLLDFKKVCETANIKYIDPCQSVEKTLGEIASSELLITEAMHGAILADAFRVPWTRIQIYSHYFEGRQVAEQKWLDWLYSMELKPQTVSFSPLLNQLLPPRFVWRQLAKIVLNQLLSDVGQFSQLAQLSSEPILQSKVAQLHQAMEDLNFEYR